MKTQRYHNIYDLGSCNENITNREVIREFLIEITQAIGMTILEGPTIADGIEENPGVTAIVIVDFSHVSVHTFTNHNEALIDIFSCREYDKDKALEVCKKYFSGPETTVRQKEVWWGE